MPPAPSEIEPGPPTTPENVAETMPGQSVALGPNQLSWLGEGTEIETTIITSDDGEVYALGSAVGKNEKITALADKVPDRESAKLNDALYKRLPRFFADKSHPTVRRAERTEGQGMTIMKFDGTGDARVFFALTTTRHPETHEEVPTAIIVGKATHNNQRKLYSIMRTDGGY